MRIITLSSGTGWHVQDLRRAAAAAGHELIPCAWKSVAAGVADGGPVARAGEVVLDGADAVLLRTMPPGSLEQIVFRMDAVHALHERGVRVVNPPRAIEAAVDKYLALRRLADAGLPVPPTVACQTLADARAAFVRLGGDAVVKPLFGSEGFGITRVCDADTADRVFAAIERIGGVIYLQRFIDHGGSDLRVLVLAGRAPAAMRRRGDGDWRTNVARGGRGEACAIDAATTALALRAARGCGAWVAGVDIAFDRGGSPFVLEVNAVPGWRELSRVTGLDVAAEVLAALANEVPAAPAAVGDGRRE